MKVKWTGETEYLMLTNNKIYDVLAVEKGWYRIIDDSGEDYLYPPNKFEIILSFNKLDGGTLNDNLAEIRTFCGLQPGQSFQDVEIDK